MTAQARLHRLIGTIKGLSTRVMIQLIVFSLSVDVLLYIRTKTSYNERPGVTARMHRLVGALKAVDEGSNTTYYFHIVT